MNLTKSKQRVADSIFADLGKHEIFTPVRSFPPMTVGELAEMGGVGALKEAG